MKYVPIGCLGRVKWPIPPELIPVSVALGDKEYFYSPLDVMLVHRRVTSQHYFAGTHLYTWLQRGTVRVKGALSRTFFGFFSKTAPKLRLSTFNHAGNAPGT